MATEKEKLIEQLTANLKPTGTQALPLARTLIWFPVFFITIALVMYSSQEYRAGFWSQVMSYPRFQIELASAIALSFIALYFSFTQFVPGEKNKSTTVWSFRAIAVLFIASLIWSFIEPTPEATMIGKRALCNLEVLIYGTITLIVLLYINRKGLLKIQPSKRLIYGLSVGMIPALLMQVACMYDPTHGLAFHFGPVLGVAILGVLFSKVMLRH